MKFVQSSGALSARVEKRLGPSCKELRSESSQRSSRALLFSGSLRLDEHPSKACHRSQRQMDRGAARPSKADSARMNPPAPSSPRAGDGKNHPGRPSNLARVVLAARPSPSLTRRPRKTWSATVSGWTHVHKKTIGTRLPPGETVPPTSGSGTPREDPRLDLRPRSGGILARAKRRLRASSSVLSTGLESSDG